MPFISFIKVYGPPLYDAIKELNKIALDFPEVCIMESSLALVDYKNLTNANYVANNINTLFPLPVPDVEVNYQRCSTLVSKSGEEIGEYDYYFEWFVKPTQEQLYALMQKIDKALGPLGCKYTMTSLNK